MSNLTVTELNSHIYFTSTYLSSGRVGLFGEFKDPLNSLLLSLSKIGCWTGLTISLTHRAFHVFLCKTHSHF